MYRQQLMELSEPLSSTELLDMISETNKIGTKTSTLLNETADSYIVNSSPTEQCLSPSPLPGEFPNSTTAHTKLKRKAPQTAARDREKKREADMKYRRNCKEKKKKNEQDLVVLNEENNKLKKENVDLKKEGGKQQEMVETQKEKIKLLLNEHGQLKAQLQMQNVVVGVLSKQVANMDLQCENKRLKSEIGLLNKKINNDDYSNLIQLQAKIIKLEQEKNDLQMITDALCAKIIKDNDVEPRQTF